MISISATRLYSLEVSPATRVKRKTHEKGSKSSICVLICFRPHRKELRVDETGSNKTAGNAQQARLQKEGRRLDHRAREEGFIL